jgi:hypothetical protein
LLIFIINIYIYKYYSNIDNDKININIKNTYIKILIIILCDIQSSWTFKNNNAHANNLVAKGFRYSALFIIYLLCSLF